MAESGALRPAKFTKVEEVRPASNGLNLIVKVINSKMVRTMPQGQHPQGRQMKVAECIVGDDTAVVVFTARNEQVEVMKPGVTIEVRNAKIDMYRGSMRLVVDRWGMLKVVESPPELTVKEDNNMSLIEFDLITVLD